MLSTAMRVLHVYLLTELLLLYHKGGGERIRGEARKDPVEINQCRSECELAGCQMFERWMHKRGKGPRKEGRWRGKERQRPGYMGKLRSCYEKPLT